MSDPNKTLDEIIAEVRESARDSFASKLVAQYEETGRLDESSAAQALKDDDAYLTRLADRMESEVRRAREEWEAVARAQDVAQASMMEEIERLRSPGSVAALRRTLEEVEGAIFEDEPGRFWLADAEEILHRVRATLAAPPEPLSDAAKMREALAWLRDNGYVGTDGGLHFTDSEKALSMIRAALAPEKGDDE